jgi:hypothetical protein
MKTIIVSVLISIGSFAWAGRGVGNPGAGIERNGVYMTFGAAGVELPVDPEPLEAVPGTALIRETVKEMGLIELQKAAIWQAILPYGARKYYNVQRDKLDQETRDKLKEEYARVTRQPKESIVIYAVTDPKTRVTFLLPEFYGLVEEAKSVILFHEGYWIMKPDATFDEVVAAEIAFDHYIQARKVKGYDRRLGQKLALLFKSPEASLNMDLAYDMRASNFRTMTATGDGILLSQIVSGEEIQVCIPESGTESVVLAKVENTLELNRLYALAEANPESVFLKTLLDLLSPLADGTLPDFKIELFNRGNIGVPPDCYGRVQNESRRIKLFNNINGALLLQSR